MQHVKAGASHMLQRVHEKDEGPAQSEESCCLLLEDCLDGKSRSTELTDVCNVMSRCARNVGEIPYVTGGDGMCSKD